MALLAAIFSTPAHPAGGEVWAREDSPAPARQTELIRLVRHDCGACHGLTLGGGLGSALTAEAMASRSLEGLRHTILNGRPGTAMPPWRGIINDEEALWVSRQLQAGFPDAR